ncbi:hypothetical protein NG701_07620 [Pseudarthrobacter sp. HLT3-5]|uniref:hypothetical protein n=1 Tax=Pseudarthrobacter cellobiosi TaxID=2953654 RepID=UPI00208E6597|nr:hypothetical protein [Pseudarthrobacter sp. HLT3-5]MCO4274297.1 hypothetical protein [Pseudarthrobacter sp. HLT3-5]
MGEVINISTRQQEVAPSLSLELRLEARKRDDYGDLGPAELIAKAEYYIDLEQTDLTPGQRTDCQSILNYLLSEMEVRDADGVRL